MARTAGSRIAWISAAGTLALALAAPFVPGSGEAAPGPAAAPAPLSLVETLVLLRWGAGALDWNLPDAKGERHARDREYRP